MARAWLEPILPKKKRIVNARKIVAELTDELSTLGTDMLRECAEYEVAPSVSYMRTNMLKRSWNKRGPMIKNGNLMVLVLSSGKIAPYNVYVRGPKRGGRGRRQAAHMAARGWRSVTEISKALWPAAYKRLVKIATSAV